MSIRFLILFLLTLYSNRLLCEEVEIDEWVDMSTQSDFIEPASSVLAARISKKLKVEGISVVSISFEECSADSYWCREFEKDFAAQLSKRDILFTHTSSAGADKDSVSSEIAYQQNSMQVSRDKRLKMGKQRAIQAILKLSVYKADSKKNGLDRELGIYNCSVRSLNIEKGVYTSSASVKVKIYRSETTDYQQVLKTGLTGVLGLGFLATAGYYGYLSYSEYMDYQDDISLLSEDNYASEEEYEKVKQGLERKKTDAALKGAAIVLGGAFLGKLTLDAASDYYKQIHGFQDHYLIRQEYSSKSKPDLFNFALLPHVRSSEFGLSLYFEH